MRLRWEPPNKGHGTGKRRSPIRGQGKQNVLDHHLEAARAGQSRPPHRQSGTLRRRFEAHPEMKEARQAL